VATGRVERGKVKVNEAVEVVGIRATLKTVVTGVEMFKKLLDKEWLETTWGCCSEEWSARTSSGGR